MCVCTLYKFIKNTEIPLESTTHGVLGVSWRSLRCYLTMWTMAPWWVRRRLILGGNIGIWWGFTFFRLCIHIYIYIPDAPCIKYLPTFGSFLGQMLVNIPHMEHTEWLVIYLALKPQFAPASRPWCPTSCSKHVNIQPQDIGMTGMTLASNMCCVSSLGRWFQLMNFSGLKPPASNVLHVEWNFKVLHEWWNEWNQWNQKSRDENEWFP